MSVIMEDVGEDSDYCEIMSSGEDDESQCSDISGLEDSEDANNQEEGSSRSALEEFKIITSEDIVKHQVSLLFMLPHNPK